MFKISTPLTGVMSLAFISFGPVASRTNFFDPDEFSDKISELMAIEKKLASTKFIASSDANLLPIPLHTSPISDFI